MKNSLKIIFGLLLIAYAVTPQTLSAASLQLTSPNGGEVYQPGYPIHITWNASGVSGNVRIHLFRQSVVGASQFVYGYTVPNTGSYSWQTGPGMEAGSDYYFEIYDQATICYEQPCPTSTVSDRSDGNFSIATSNQLNFVPSISSLVPTSGPPGTAITVTGSGFHSYNDIAYQCQNYGTGTVTHVVSGDLKTLQFQIPEFLPAGSCSISIVNSNGSSGSLGFMVVPYTGNASHAVGTNVAGPDGTVYLISSGKTRSPYTSAGAFLSYKFNTWAGVVKASSADMALSLTTYVPTGETQVKTLYIPPRNGSLINDRGTVYLITNGLRAGFSSAKVFADLGYSFSNVYNGDTSFMVTLMPINSSAIAHPDGTLINDNGTIYVIKNGNRMGFPDMTVLNSWGYWVKEAAPANFHDRLAPISGVVQTRMTGQLNI